MSGERDKDRNEQVINPDTPIEPEMARLLLHLRHSARAGILAGTPKYRIVLAIRDRGLKLETARALVTLAERSLTSDDYREVGLVPPDQVGDSPIDEATLIRQLETLISANYEH